MDDLKLMCVLAHPDDESLGTGGILARYAAEGVATFLVTATRGEHGWPHPEPYPGPEALGATREAELRAAAAILGIRETIVLPYIDGTLDQAAPEAAIALIVQELRRIRPQVVVTFGPDGAYGHPDHIAISQFTAAAVVCAADPDYAGASDLPPHAVAKLYFMTMTAELGRLYEGVFGELLMEIDGVPRGGVAWPDWMITSRIDTADHWHTVLRAILCHRTQLPNAAVLVQMPEAQQRAIWGSPTYYRVLSSVNGGRGQERDLFAGLR
jgi:LmbE family N-acetylglucosaminyl deacetylase